jgi:hypothetical protein
MGVGLVHPSMGGPSRVTEPRLSMKRSISDSGAKLDDLAGDLFRDQAMPVLDDDPGRIVAPVFHALEAIKQDAQSLTSPHVSHDSAHL